MEIVIGFGKNERPQREKGKSLLDFPSNYVLFDIDKIFVHKKKSGV